MSNTFNQNSESKVRFIITLFKRYQPNLNINEQLSLLDSWVNSCVLSEEYEMASVLIKEKKYIQKNPKKVPKRSSDDLIKDDLIKDNPLFKTTKKDVVTPIEVIEPEIVVKKVKLPIYRRIINKIKKFFKWRN